MLKYRGSVDYMKLYNKALRARDQSSMKDMGKVMGFLSQELSSINHSMFFLGNNNISKTK